MKNNKKLIGLILMIAMVVSIVGCGKQNSSNEQEPKQDNKLTLVTSFYPMYIFTKNIVKDTPNVDVVNMTEPQTGCLHDYQLSTADMKTLESANVLIINGAGMESFMDKVIHQMPNLKVVEASKGIELMKSEDEHHEDEHHEDEHHEDGDIEFNPHVWVGISGAIQEVRNITNELAKIDSKNEENYTNNGNEYIKKLEDLKNKMVDSLKNLQYRDVITFHEAFPYFAKEFDLNIVGVIQSEPGQEPTAQERVNIINIVKDKKVKALFIEEQYPPKVANTIANETGAKIYELDLVVTGPKEADPGAYIKAMEKNMKVLLEALK